MRFRLLARTFVLGLVAAVFACSSDPDGTNPDPKPPSGTTDAGTTGDELPKTCEGLVDALKEFSSTHTACSDTKDCQNVDDLGNSAICSLSFNPSADIDRLRRLKEQFTKLDCGGTVECGSGGPLTLSCNQGTCGFTDPGAACQKCPSDIDPVCTSDGTIARNPCLAECAGGTIKHKGPCETGPKCAAKGATCELLKEEPGQWFCPEGQRFEPLDSHSDCAPAYSESTCCQPGWNFPCTYLGIFSATLSLDPFTCEPSKKWPVCMFSKAPESCSVEGDVGLSVGEGKIDRLDDQTTIAVETGARLKVKGHAADGRTFECTGVASTKMTGKGAAWDCKACTGDACKTCTIQQTFGCKLP